MEPTDNEAPHKHGTNGSSFPSPDAVPTPKPSPTRKRPPEVAENRLQATIDAHGLETHAEQSLRQFSKINPVTAEPYQSHMWTSSPTFENLRWSAPVQKRCKEPPKSDGPTENPVPTSELKSDIVRFRVNAREKGKRTGAIEICCGYAGLTAALADAGLEAAGVDWKGNRHNPQVPIVTADLTTEKGQEFVRQLVQQEHVLYVHLAPPCGTCTGARGILIPQWKLDNGQTCRTRSP